MEIGQRIATFGLGLGAMYFLDPDRGKRRRALMRDKLARMRYLGGDALATVGNDAPQRAHGLAAALNAGLKPDQAPDEVLSERIRTAMGRVVRHPGSIEVAVKDGCATLSGPILKDEVERALARARSIRGITKVENQLTAFDTSEGVSGLQGAPRPRVERFELLQENWAPTARLAMAAAGVGVAVLGSKSSKLRMAAVPVGIAMAARGITNIPMPRLLGVGGAGVEVQKDITVGAPVHQTFELMTHDEHFPQFMTHVRKVSRSAQEGRSHWSVTGPPGFEMNWDVQITKLVDDKLLAWKTLPGSMVQHSGIVRFDPMGDGRTRLDIKMSYKPPLGFIGHSVAAMFAERPQNTDGRRPESNEDVVGDRDLPI